MKLAILGFLLVSCSFSTKRLTEEKPNADTKVIVGAENLSEYFDLISNKKVGLVVNHTSMTKKGHLVDFLHNKKINIEAIFAPEHGFRGEASAGDLISNSKDKNTGAPIYSLYGKNKKPTQSQLKGLDVVVFDIQDVGVRFYTYISTLFYVQQACAENGIKLIVLDRPNPNGHYVAGPVLDMAYTSFVGIAPIPVVYGLTIGELAGLYNGEGYLGKGLICDLTVIKNKNYKHKTPYDLPIKPSPNLPNYTSILLYPSICLMEPTQISVGRGTDKQFQILGGPDSHLGEFLFTPEDKPGAENPVNEGKLCYGDDYSQIDAYQKPFSLEFICKFYHNFTDQSTFFTNKKFFNLLIGNDWVIKDIEAGLSANEIEKKWQADLEKFKITRKKYLLYE
jgi:uncharacterized protein YbbC (DUF1343 family)